MVTYCQAMVVFLKAQLIEGLRINQPSQILFLLPVKTHVESSRDHLS
jgi:hypothetical protein